MGIRNIKFWSALALAGCLLNSVPGEATITLVSVTGASNIELATTDTKTTLYGGFAGTCTADSNSSETCDSCTGELVSGTRLWPCNKKNAYPNLKINIRVQSNSTSVAVGDAIVKINDEVYDPAVSPTLVDGVLNVQIAWSEICQKVNGNACTSNLGSTTLSVGFRTTADSSTTDDVYSFKVIGRVAAASDLVYTNCPTDDTAVPGGSGYCHFQTYRGDEKIYADQLRRSPDFPASTASGITYAGPVFFYREQASGEDDNTTIQNLSNASDYFLLNDPEQDNRIEGLTNEVRYCMVMANQDKTGVISFFTPLPGTSGGVDAITLCATPSKVVGLLDDKSCFIATAAFGSDMAPEVQSFRDFRNEFLLSNKLGRAVVKFYYKHSPFYAHMIAESELTKMIVRGALWPLLIFARISVQWGFWPTLALTALLTSLSAVVLRRRQVWARRFRGGL